MLGRKGRRPPPYAVGHVAAVHLEVGWHLREIYIAAIRQHQTSEPTTLCALVRAEGSGWVLA